MLEQETIKIKQATKKGYAECKIGGVADFSFPDSKTRRGRVEAEGDIAPTIMAANCEVVKIEVKKNNFYEQAIKTAEEKKTAILSVVEKYRIRKLTPKECWRLMGFTDEDFEKAAMVNSNSQLYKQAGNSIVKNVLMAIFSKMVVEE